MGVPLIAHAEVPSNLGIENRPLVNTLRVLRTEVQDLQDMLAQVRNGEVLLSVAAVYIETTKQDLMGLFEGLENLAYESGTERVDDIRRIVNAWEKMQTSPLIADPLKKYDSQELLNYIKVLEGYARRLIFEVGSLTILSRLQHWLDKSRPGHYIPFHAVFEDELPVYEDRVRLLSYLGWAPDVLVGGLVDVVNGVVYRYDPRKGAGRRSAFRLALSFLIATTAVVASCFVSISGWPFAQNDLGVLIFGWFATLVGVGAHVLISNAKQAKNPNANAPVIAPSEFLSRINANEGRLYQQVCLALIGFFITVFAVGVNTGTVLATFLAGYSLDSVLDLAGTGLDQQASAQATILKERVKSTG